MTKEELAQYGYLRVEIAELEHRLRGLHQLGERRESAELPKLHQTLFERRERCYRELLRLENFFSSIEDSRIRLIFSLRYAENLSWRQVALAIGEQDEQFPRRLHNRFLKSTEQGRCE